jgi:hypothetical protein
VVKIAQSFVWPKYRNFVKKLVMVKVGDKVRFLNAVGGGTVTKIFNNKMVAIENHDGFEIPTLITELVVIESSYDNYSTDKSVKESKIAEPEKKPDPISIIIPGKDSPDFYLAFVPQDEINPVGGEIEVWLVNDSNYSLLYNYSHFLQNKYKNVRSGQLGSNSSFQLESFVQFDLAEFPEFVFQIIYFAEESNELYQPVIRKIKVNPVKFYREKTFGSNSFFKKNAYLIAITNNLMAVEFDKLTESDIEKVISQKEKEMNQPENQTEAKQDIDLIEVDLHINQLIDNTSGLTNHELLEIQMNRFVSEMESAIKNRAKRIVFIHGIGQGTLKYEILQKLKQQYKKYYVQDASFKEYGYGATMVILKK